MTDQVLTERHGAWGLIKLNRPEAINALNAEMIAAISQAFARFQQESAVKVILFEGEGARGFCAGGDVRAVRTLVLEGNQAAADQFFVDEYRLNAAIAQSPKPVVALTDGIVMGGGLGLAGHATHRITTNKSRFAMPESAIGLICDVGVNAIVRSKPKHLVMPFLLSGSPVGAADAIALGLTDHVVNAEDMGELRNEILDLDGENLTENLRSIVARYEVTTASTPFADQAELYLDIMQTADLAEMMTGLGNLATGDTGAKELLDLLLTRCPTSLAMIWHAHLAARQDIDLKAIFHNDLVAAHFMIRRSDYSDGVNAVLIAKTSAPTWSPSTLDKVDLGSILPALIS